MKFLTVVLTDAQITDIMAILKAAHMIPGLHEQHKRNIGHIYKVLHDRMVLEDLGHDTRFKDKDK